MVTFSRIIPADVDLIQILPHAHFLCREMTVEAYLPNGSVTRLIHIPDWDINWQATYQYQQPVRLPKSTRIQLSYVYDNSASNLRNPSSPPRRVTFGEASTDEMALLILTVALVEPGSTKAFQRSLNVDLLEQSLQEGAGIAQMPDVPRVQLLFKWFDRNHNGKLDRSEQQALIIFLRRFTGVVNSPYWPIMRTGSILLGLGSLGGMILLASRLVGRLRRST